MKATSILYKLNPVTPEAPKKFITKPPTKAPTIPKIISIMTPPDPLETIDANHPAINPKIIHVTILINVLLKYATV